MCCWPNKRSLSLHSLELERTVQREVTAALCVAKSNPHNDPRRWGIPPRSQVRNPRPKVAFEAGPPLPAAPEFVTGHHLPGDQFRGSVEQLCCTYTRGNLLRSPRWVEAAAGLEAKSPADL